MNSLTLTIVNEGRDYQERLATARVNNPAYRFNRWAERVAEEAERQAWGCDFTVADMAQAVVELEDYYQAHIKEPGATKRRTPLNRQPPGPM